jgi:hypothetical protein
MRRAALALLVASVVAVAWWSPVASAWVIAPPLAGLARLLSSRHLRTPPVGIAASLHFLDEGRRTVMLSHPYTGARG